DVVVIADDDVGLLDQLERYFEGADFRRLRHLESEVGIEVAHRGRHAGDEAALLHFFRIARREWTEVFVTDHLGVRVHLLFRTDEQYAEAAVVQQLQRFDGRLLLQRLRCEVEKLLAALERLANRRKQRGDRLADAGRRGDEKCLTLPDRAVDGVDDLLLKRP